MSLLAACRGRGHIVSAALAAAHLVCIVLYCIVCFQSQGRRFEHQSRRTHPAMDKPYKTKDGMRQAKQSSHCALKVFLLSFPHE